MNRYSFLALLLLATPVAQAEEPCGKTTETISSDIQDVLSEKRTSPCAKLEKELRDMEQRRKELLAKKKLADAQFELWSQLARYYRNMEKHIMEGNFGKYGDSAQAGLMSVEIVLDALVVGKAVTAGAKGAKAFGTGSKALRGAARSATQKKLIREGTEAAMAFGASSAIEVLKDMNGRSGSPAQMNMQAEMDRFQTKWVAPEFQKANSVIKKNLDPSFSLVDLIPFVGVAKRANRWMSADDQIAALGDAYEVAAKEAFRQRRMLEGTSDDGGPPKGGLNDQIADLTELIGAKKAEINDCNRGGSS